jgi:hypothetical protein
MKNTSRARGSGRIVQHHARNLPRRSEKVVAALRCRAEASDVPVDTTDIPEQSLTDGMWVRGGRRVGGIRGAIIEAMQRQGLTRYQLWKKSRVLCGRIPSSAVYEYLDGRRQVGGTYIEAMLEALKLEVRPKASA